MIIEVRGNDNQTVFPGSIHESGEAITFESEGEPAQTDWQTLEVAARKIAVATVIYKAWEGGNRHEVALALSAFLATRGWAKSDVEQIITAIAKERCDNDLRDRQTAVTSTFEKVSRGEVVAWRETFSMLLSKETIVALEKWVPATHYSHPTSVSNGSISLHDLTTNAGAADAFVEAHRGRLIWATGQQEWYRLDNAIYRKIDPVIVQGAAKEFLQDASNNLGLHAKTVRSRNHINATVELSRAGLSVDPETFDTDENLFGLSDGSVLDLSDQTLVSDPSTIVTKAGSVVFDPEATCPIWEAFLDRIFESDREVISFLQRAVGYSLSGSVKEQAAFILIGKGANGKSTFLYILQHLFGDYATTVPMQTLMEQGKFGNQTNDLASLFGKRLVVASEGERDQKLAENKIKLMTGGDRIKCRHLYQDYFEFEPVFKLWLATNNLPLINGSDDAIWRRLRIIDFPVSIPPEEQDPDLAKTLLSELPGILNWALEGHRKWKECGLQPPESVMRSIKSYRNENDIVGQWIESCCSTGCAGSTAITLLHGSYATWCQKSGFEALSREAFGKELTRKGFQNIKARDGNRRKGIILNDDDFEMSVSGEKSLSFPGLIEE